MLLSMPRAIVANTKCMKAGHLPPQNPGSLSHISFIHNPVMVAQHVESDGFVCPLPFTLSHATSYAWPTSQVTPECLLDARELSNLKVSVDYGQSAVLFRRAHGGQDLPC